MFKRFFGLLMGVLMLTSALAPTVAQDGDEDYTDIYGNPLPEDAAPASMQTFRIMCGTGTHTTFDFAVAVYQRICSTVVSDRFGLQLTNLDQNFNVVPMAAESWQVLEDGVTWQITIKDDLVWSDGTPLTAYDYEATYKYSAEPEHAWDFSWMYMGVIKNWREVVAGDVPMEELGIRAVDDYTLEFETEAPYPAFPSMLQYSWPLQKAQMEEYGPNYNVDPETSVSSGRWLLDTYIPDDKVVLVPNPDFNGPWPPRLRKVEGFYGEEGTSFIAFQNYDIDMTGVGVADLEIVKEDPVLMDNFLLHYGDFRSDYISFDFKEPFDDINVRLAFAKAVDRKSIYENVVTPLLGVDNRSFLMIGFPASDKEGELQDVQAYDCEAAQQLLADAGYPDGEGFPAQELWLRTLAPGSVYYNLYAAAAQSISECLNVDIEVSSKDYALFMENLNSYQIPLYGVSYGMDYLDPSNLLTSLWQCGSRHAWCNEEFDRISSEAAAYLGDPQERLEMFQEAEKIMVEDVAAIFLGNRWAHNLFQPYIMGEVIREPDDLGIAAWHWGSEWALGSMYISKDVMDYDTYRTQ